MCAACGLDQRPDQAFLCADRVAMLHDGRLTRLGIPDEVITAESLKQIDGVDVAVTRVPLEGGGEHRVCILAVTL